MTKLETERLALTPFGTEDLDGFHAIWGDPEVIWWGANESLTATRTAFERLLERHTTWPAGVTWFAVRLRNADEILGDVLLQPAPFAPGIEIGWHFRRSAWGKGYATEAARAVLAHAFTTLRLDCVYAIVARQNTRSLRLTGKLGMQRERDLVYADLPHTLFRIEADTPAT